MNFGEELRITWKDPTEYHDSYNEGEPLPRCQMLETLGWYIGENGDGDYVFGVSQKFKGLPLWRQQLIIPPNCVLKVERIK
jgi:hypothetical protein